MASTSSAAPPASFSAAFERLRDTVTKDEARTFASTSMKDVWSTAKETERYLESRRKLRGFHRIRLFLEGIEKYSKAVDVLCNGTPYLPYIWAPIKLLLQIAQDHLSALDKLIDAYAMIGEAMPRFDRLSAAFREDPEFQQVMGYFYEDVLEFHRRAYKFFRRRAWKTVFDSLWKTFNPRFQGILENLRKHRDLIDQEANALNIAEAKAWRTKQLEQIRQWRVERAEDLERVEHERIVSQTREAVAWFGEAQDQEDLLLKLSRACDGNHDHWILKEPTIMSWLEPAQTHAFVWLNGKPGAGKSVICSEIIEHLQDTKGQVVVYYFCNNHQILQRPANDILRSFAGQLLAASTGLAPYILETFVNHGLRPTKKSLGAILEKLITSLPSVRIVVDGLDECPQNDQDEIIDDLLRIKGAAAGACKILLSSRKLPNISKLLHTKPTLRLDENHENVNLTISSFIRPRLEDLRQKFNSEMIDELGHQILAKANGMFLWVKLIMVLIEDLHYEVHVREAIEMLPEGLPALYEKILSHICGEAKTPNQRVASRILQWMLVAQRPLKRYELESGIILDERVPQITPTSKARGDVLSLCSPILEVEDGPSGYVGFVHFTAKEFLQNFYDSPILQKFQAQLTVSLSCVLYLTSSLNLVDPHIADDEKRSQVALCLHELHLYANDHWVDHLRALVNLPECSSVHEPRILSLRRSLDRLTDMHNNHLSPQDQNVQDENDLDAVPREDPWEALGISYAARNLLNKTLVYRNNASVKGGLIDSVNADSDDDQDPSLFTSIRTRYQHIVENLLGQQHTSDTALDEFYARHNSGAFFCRYRNCPRATQGFGSSELRMAHEGSHVPQFRCTNSECGFFGWTYNTRGALKKHAEQYHQKDDLLIPNALRRKSIHPHQEKALFRFNAAPLATNNQLSQAVESRSTGLGIALPTNAPRLDRTMSDIYQDELHSPATQALSSSSMARPTVTTSGNLLSAPRSKFSSLVQHAYNGHISARENPPLTNTASRLVSPIRDYSTFDEESRHNLLHSPETISPGETFLYKSDEASKMPLFPLPERMSQMAAPLLHTLPQQRAHSQADLNESRSTAPEISFDQSQASAGIFNPRKATQTLEPTLGYPQYSSARFVQTLSRGSETDFVTPDSSQYIKAASSESFDDLEDMNLIDPARETYSWENVDPTKLPPQDAIRRQQSINRRRMAKSEEANVTGEFEENTAHHPHSSSQQQNEQLVQFYQQNTPSRMPNALHSSLLGQQPTLATQASITPNEVNWEEKARLHYEQQPPQDLQQAMKQLETQLRPMQQQQARRSEQLQQPQPPPDILRDPFSGGKRPTMLQAYQMQLMKLEGRRKKRLRMAWEKRG